jgi:D-alanyl-D-alanine carboxypeptidase (penicillin-binding protein 5/6)
MTEFWCSPSQRKITLTQTFGVSEKAWKMPGSRMFIDPKMQVPVEFRGADAVKRRYHGALRAEGAKVEHFVELINQQAKARWA